MTRRFLALAPWLVTAAFVGAPEPIRAETDATTTTASEWSFAVTPYVWFAGLEGDVGVGGLPPAHVDASFSDIIENTDLAIMLAAEARRSRWGLILDLVYLGVSQDADTPGPLFGEAALEADTVFATLEGAYRFVEAGGVDVDALAGARFWYIDTELDLDAGLLPGRNAEGSEFWADPVIGLRANLDLGRGVFLTALADIGGFGVSSDITWQALATIGYEANRWLSLRGGYRHLMVDYEDGGFVFDVEMSGPIIGASFRF